MDVALQDALLFQSNGYPMLAALGVPLPRMGSQFVVAAPAAVFECCDGHVMAGVLLDSHWKILARVIGRAELADDPEWSTAAARIANRDAANALMSDFVRPRTVAEVTRLFAARGLPVSAVRTYAQAVDDPHVLERDMLQRHVLEDGSAVPAVGPAAKFSRTPTRVRSGAPGLGVHTDELLDELGISAERRSARTWRTSHLDSLANSARNRPAGSGAR